MKKRWWFAQPLAAVVLFVGLLLLARANYLLFHSIAELFSITVATSAFVVVWNARRGLENGALLWIGTALLSVAALDLLHTLAYSGMGVFPDSGVDLATQLWIAARYVAAFGLVLAPLLLGVRLSSHWVVAGFGALTALMISAIFWWDIFPTCYDDRLAAAAAGRPGATSPLTPFKIISEYVVCGLLALAAVLLILRGRRRMDRDVLVWLTTAIVVTIASELAFTGYRDPYALPNLVGHYLKIVAYYILYYGLVAAAMARPQQTLFRELANREAALRASQRDREALLASEQVARADAEQANRSKDEFLATVSHELRTPLNAILGWAQLLRRGGLAPREFAEGLAAVESNARVQKALIEDLLDISRIISGKFRLETRKLDVRAVVQAALATVQPGAAARQVRLESETADAPVSVLGDPARLQQVVWNLLTNAIKFTPAGGSIRVSVRQADGRVEVRVTDTGEGIPAEHLAHIFDRFRQVRRARSGGLGLGLSIVRHLVELHGGAVAAQSPGRGQGATFTVSLPGLDGAPRLPHDALVRAAGPPAVANSRDAALAGLRILVVEDDAGSREFVRRLIEESGGTALTAASATEGFELLRNERPDVLVSDISMPGEDGYQLLRRIRGLKPDEGGATPAIALTALSRQEDHDEALRSGFQVHVGKPLDVTELVAAIQSLARPEAAARRESGAAVQTGAAGGPAIAPGPA